VNLCHSHVQFSLCPKLQPRQLRLTKASLPVQQVVHVNPHGQAWLLEEAAKVAGSFLVKKDAAAAVHHGCSWGKATMAESWRKWFLKQACSM